MPDALLEGADYTISTLYEQTVENAVI